MLGSEVDAIMGVGNAGGLGSYFFVNMECCGTREEKIKLKVCGCIGFGRGMDLVSAWGRWDGWC